MRKSLSFQLVFAPVLLLLLLSGRALAAVVFSENMGTPSGTTAIASNAFQNSGTLTFSGTGDVRNTSTSTGYTGASAGGNVFLTTSGNPNFLIGSIDTSGYVAGSLSLTFGAFKNATASDMTDLSVEFSTNGTSFTALAFPAQPTGAGTANWRLVTVTSTTIPLSPTLTLRWTNSGTATQYRIDDVTLSGTPTPEPASLGTLLLAGMFAARRRRR